MSEKHSRQSFLGPNSEEIITSALPAVIGLGGGGSHIVQQLAHLGFKRYVLYDGDGVEDSNLNRLVGGTVEDARKNAPKTEVATRVIRGLEPEAEIIVVNKRWQDEPEHLLRADVVIGCVDSFSERAQLEAACRRHAIPLIDIGLDLHRAPNDDEPPVLAGQVILSMPGHLCMRCIGFITEERLAEEARRYGAGSRPQVVYANGVLASTAVGLAVDLLTDWTRGLRGPVYLSYRANTGVLEPHVRLKYAPRACEHYPLTEAGDARLRRL